jgi:hypothetical protein
VRQQLPRGERAGAGGGQLDRQRHPVEPPTQLDDGGALRRRGVAARARRPGAVLEQARGGRGLQLGGIVAGGQREGTQHEHLLAVEGERLAAGGEHVQGGGGGEQLAAQPGGHRQHVLAVVEHQQRGLVAEAEQQRVEGRKAELARHRRGDLAPRRERRQLAAAHAAREAGRVVPTPLGDEPRLPDPAGPHHRHQAPCGDALAEPRALGVAPEERRDRGHAGILPHDAAAPRPPAIPSRKAIAGTLVADCLLAARLPARRPQERSSVPRAPRRGRPRSPLTRHGDARRKRQQVNQRPRDCLSGGC